MTKLQKPARDADIDVLVRATGNRQDADIYHASYLSRSTIKRLRQRKTRYPSHMTMVGVAAACGLEWKLTRKGRK